MIQKSSYKLLTFFLFFSLAVSGLVSANTPTEEPEEVESLLQNEDSLAAVIRTELAALSPEKLASWAQQFGINPQGMNSDQIKDAITQQILVSMSGHRSPQVAGSPDSSELQNKSYKKEFFGLLFAAMMRRVGFLMAENPNSEIFSTLFGSYDCHGHTFINGKTFSHGFNIVKGFGSGYFKFPDIDFPAVGTPDIGIPAFSTKSASNKALVALLTLPLRYVFPFLMAGKDQGTKMVEQVINQEDNKLTENQKKLYKFLARMPGTFIGNGVDLEGEWLRKECGQYLGRFAEISLIQLLPAFLYQRYQTGIYADGKMNDAVVDSADIIKDLLRVEAYQLITNLVGKNTLEKIQDKTLDIINPELITDIGISSVTHWLLQAYGYEGGKGKAADYFWRELKLHCATGVGSTMLLTKQGDAFTKVIGAVGDKVGNFLVWLGLTDKASLQTMVKGGKFVMQKFVGPLFMNQGSKLEAIHHMMKSGNFNGFEKDKSFDRSVARFVVRNIVSALMSEYKNYNENKHSPLSGTLACTKISALLSAWYLYRSEGAGTLEELLMGDASEWQEMQQIKDQDPMIRAKNRGFGGDLEQSELDPKFA